MTFDVKKSISWLKFVSIQLYEKAHSLIEVPEKEAMICERPQTGFFLVSYFLNAVNPFLEMWVLLATAVL